MATKGMTAVMKEFFGYHPADLSKGGMSLADVKSLPYEEGVAAGGIRGFAVELGRLNGDEKLELARGAAKELGYTQGAVDFPLA